MVCRCSCCCCCCRYRIVLTFHFLHCWTNLAKKQRFFPILTTTAVFLSCSCVNVNEEKEHLISSKRGNYMPRLLKFSTPEQCFPSITKPEFCCKSPKSVQKHLLLLKLNSKKKIKLCDATRECYHEPFPSYCNRSGPFSSLNM